MSFCFHASGVCNKSGAIRFAIAPYGLDVLFPGKGQMHRLAGAQQLIKKISEPLVVFCDGSFLKPENNI